MRIALIRRRYTDFGGAERYVAALAGRLRALGHEVHVLAAQWEVRGSNVKVHRVPVRPGPGFVRILSFAASAARLVREMEFDIVHSFERTVCQDVYRAGDGCHREWLIRRRRADPFYKRATYRLNPLHLAYLYLEGRLFTDSRLKRVVANSKRGKAEIVRHYGVDPDRIRVIYNGFDAGRFSGAADLPIPLPPGGRFLLFVGSGFERKGLATAIRALARIPDAGVKLVVVGRDSPRRMQRLAARLGVEQRVVFAGPQSRVEPFYRAASVFVLPSLYEPFSNACLEAAALGVPVVTTRVNGFSELIRHGENGFVLEDPLDAEEAARAIRQALEKGRMEPMTLPTMEENVERTLALYQEIRSGS